MEISRRSVLAHLFGNGLIGLRALATGLPISFITCSTRAALATTGRLAPQKLIFITNVDGCPTNVYCGWPASLYQLPQIIRSTDPTMAPMSYTTATGQQGMAAKVWSGLGNVNGASVLENRTMFFHLETLTANHGDQNKVMMLQGNTKPLDMMVSIFARYLGAVWGTVQNPPIVLGSPGAHGIQQISYQGSFSPNLSPSALKMILGSTTGVLGNLQRLRDSTLSQINSYLKQSGTAAQRRYLDNYVNSQIEARNLSLSLLADLDSISDDPSNLQPGDPAIKDNNLLQARNQVRAAAIMMKMNVAPVVVIRIPFGGDNHGDTNFKIETSQHIDGIASLNLLLQTLTSYGIQDQVSIASLNVFGRELVPNISNGDGRSHYANHAVMFCIGANVNPMIIGGVGPDTTTTQPMVQNIDSKTGNPTPSGDILTTSTLGSAAVTLGLLLGIDINYLNQNIVSLTGSNFIPVMAALKAT